MRSKHLGCLAPLTSNNECSIRSERDGPRPGRRAERLPPALRPGLRGRGRFPLPRPPGLRGRRETKGLAEASRSGERRRQSVCDRSQALGRPCEPPLNGGWPETPRVSARIYLNLGSLCVFLSLCVCLYVNVLWLVLVFSSCSARFR